MQLVDIEPDDPRLVDDLLPVLLELRPHLEGASLCAIYAEGYPQGLRFLAAYEDGSCVGVAGWRFVATTHVGRKLYVDDLVTTARARSAGVGAALLAELAQRASAAACSSLELDSGVQRARAHAFYFREGMHVSSYHFIRKLQRSD
ncbi:MAG: GNAT family N-acetyltransferase [Actinomycetes bacterium]